jgi:hypothetical protein
MSSFGDELRAVLAKKAASLLARQVHEERQLEAAKRRCDDTRRAAARLGREVFLPLLEEFREVMEAAGLFCGGRVEELQNENCKMKIENLQRPAAQVPRICNLQSPPSPPPAFCCRLRAMGTAPNSPHYEIRIACTASEEGRIELSVECCDTTAAEFSSGQPAKALVEFPAKGVAALNLNADAVRQWCAGLLKKCADACLEANGRRS